MAHTPAADASDTRRNGRTREEAAHDVLGGKVKTSAAAVFALVFGLSAFFSVLTLLLSPLAIVLGLVAAVLGFVGLRKSREPRVAGKGVAVGGLVLGVLGLLLALALLGGAATFLQNEANVARIEGGVQQLRQQLPTP